jgi:hypothetical protein
MADAQKHTGSYIDPAGAVYVVDGRILRGIHSDFTDFFTKVLQNPLVREMLGKQIVETEIVQDRQIGYPLALEHRPVSPASYCYEWSAQMLRDAALLTLDICLRLTETGLTLKDASPWNVLFEGSRPIFVDFTSIMEEDPHLAWVAYDQFCRLFLFPLVLHSLLNGRVARALLMDATNGIADHELTSLLPFGVLLRLPWLIGRVYLPRTFLNIIHTLGKGEALGAISKRFIPSREARRAFYKGLRKDVLSVRLKAGKSRWSKYYENIESFFHSEGFNLKQATVAQILEKCAPNSVVDIGCNIGGYSILAAQAGAQVTAFDSDEDSVGLLYQLVKQKSLNILPLVMDILSPSPAYGWRCMQFSPAVERFRSEMALALALVHHLAITQRQTFERIVLALADYAEKWLLIEFVPLDDPRVIELLATNQREMSWYTLENFIEALRSVFQRVETYPSHPEGRVLILCER